MKLLMSAALLFSLAMAGCSGESSSADSDAPGKEAEGNKAAEGKGTEVALSPENTKIQFVGKHTDKTKDDRTGTFSKFSGQARVKEGELTSVHVDIETASVTTGIDNLTNHLKSPDFFDVREHPKAKFQSTKIEADGEGKVKITGDLTLLGTTKSITFPAAVSTEDGLSLKAEFTLDRTEFGMDYGQEGVEKEVDMTITVGQ